MNKYKPKEFLKLKFGRPIKAILQNQGFRDEYLKDYIKKLEDERKERRGKERSEFGISQNEFPPEDDLNFTAKDLFDAIFDEYKGEFKSEIKKKILDKVI